MANQLPSFTSIPTLQLPTFAPTTSIAQFPAQGPPSIPPFGGIAALAPAVAPPPLVVPAAPLVVPAVPVSTGSSNFDAELATLKITALKKAGQGLVADLSKYKAVDLQAAYEAIVNSDGWRALSDAEKAARIAGSKTTGRTSPAAARPVVSTAIVASSSAAPMGDDDVRKRLENETITNLKALGQKLSIPGRSKWTASDKETAISTILAQNSPDLARLISELEPSKRASARATTSVAAAAPRAPRVAKVSMADLLNTDPNQIYPADFNAAGLGDGDFSEESDDSETALLDAVAGTSWVVESESSDVVVLKFVGDGVPEPSDFLVLGFRLPRKFEARTNYNADTKEVSIVLN